MLDKLNNIANKLDELGLYRQATTTTNIMKKIADNSIDILFTDPPYALGSEVIIRKDGKPDYKKRRDDVGNKSGQEAFPSVLR